MTIAALNIVSDGMDSLGLEYGFGVYEGDPVVYPYFVGEYQETGSLTEDGLQETTFMLNGFSRTDWESLETAKEAIENYFDKVSGLTMIADNGNGICVSYENALIIPTGDAELKRIQINLRVQEWKVN